MRRLAMRTLGKAAAERALSVGPGRMRAMTAAVIAGGATAALTYRALRSGADGGR